MPTTIIGLFKEPETAHRARKALSGEQLPEDAVTVFDRATTDLTGDLADRGVPEEDGQAFADAVATGAAVLVMTVESDTAETILALLDTHGAHASDRYDAQEESGDRSTERQMIQEVEEEVTVGKRRVATGGVRASTRVTERPVEKTVTLTEEQVDVTRRDAGRELSPEEAERAFKETSVEVTETAEEAQVRKAARLIGEVEIAKTEQERTETIKDTARRTEVDVEKIEAGTKKSRP